MIEQGIDWADPGKAWLFALIGLVVLGVVAHLLWRSRLLTRFGDLPLIRRMTADVSTTAQVVRWVLLIVSVAAIATALLRPRYGTREAQLRNRGIDVVIVLDMSKSMMVRDVAPYRLQAAVGEIDALLDQLTGGRVALVPFAGTAFTQTPLTTDFEAVRSYLSELRVEHMPIGGTKIGEALVHAIRLLEPDAALAGKDPDGDGGEPAEDDDEAPEASHFKAIVLVTDGDNQDELAEKAALRAKERNIRIFCVGLGSQSSAARIPIIDDEGDRVGWATDGQDKPRFSDLNVALLRTLANTTDGEALVYGEDNVAVRLAKGIDALEKAEYEHYHDDLKEDRFQFLLVPAFLLLIFETLIMDRRRRRRRLGARR